MCEHGEFSEQAVLAVLELTFVCANYMVQACLQVSYFQIVFELPWHQAFEKTVESLCLHSTVWNHSLRKIMCKEKAYFSSLSSSLLNELERVLFHSGVDESGIGPDLLKFFWDVSCRFVSIKKRKKKKKITHYNHDRSYTSNSK